MMPSHDETRTDPVESREWDNRQGRGVNGESPPPRPRLLSGPPGFRPASRWGPLTAIALALAILAASFLAGAALSFAAVAATGGDDRVLAQLTVLLGAQVVAIALTWLGAGPDSGRAARELALHRPGGGLTTYLAALGLMLTCLAAISFVAWLFDPGSLTRDLAPFVELVRSPHWWLAVLVVGVGAPLMEELLFRGFLLNALGASRLGMVGASLLTTAAWTLLHAGYSLVGMVSVMLVGLYFCWVVWRTGSTRVTIFCHAIYNTAIVLTLMVIDLPQPAAPV